MKLENLLVKFYVLIHGKLHLPGGGWLIKKLVPYLPGLRAYPLEISGIGIATVDFSDEAAFAVLNFHIGEYHEQSLLRCMEKFLQPGAVLWDVGANVGYVSSYFAHPRYKLSAIHAFEPTQKPLKTLRSLFQNHKIVQIHEIGLGDQEGRFKINACLDGSEISSLTRKLPNSVPLEITIRRGDNVRSDFSLPAPDVLKIDVEGFEPNVLDGFSKTIAENRPVIFFEHTWLTDEQVRGLVPESYWMYFIWDNGMVIEDFSSRMKGHNAILIPTEKKAILLKQRSTLGDL